MAEVSVGSYRLPLPARDLSPGPADLAVRPNRVEIEAGSNPGAIPARIVKVTYVGGYMEYTIDTEFGRLFVISNDIQQSHAQGSNVSVKFSSDGPVLLSVAH